MNGSTNRLYAAWTLWTLLLLLGWDATGLDLVLAHAAGGAQGFPLHESWVSTTVLHEDVLPLAWLLVAWLTLGIFFPTWIQKRLDWRARLQWALGAWLPLIVVNLLKLTSTTSCPWDLAEFGGAAHYVSHWAWGVADGGNGHCFPAGHASAGFVFLNGYFVWHDRDPVVAKRWLFAGLAAGAVLGVSQQLRGAHYLSHTLWTAWICWTIGLAIALAFKAAPAKPKWSPTIQWHAVGFWAVIVLSRALGETGGDALSTTLQLGLLPATALIAIAFAVFLFAQRHQRTAGPGASWAALVASTIVGTTIADSLSETAGIGAGGTALLLVGALAVLFLWRHESFSRIRPDQSGWSGIPAAYWVAAILASTLGVAVADCVGAFHGVGLAGAAILFAGLIALLTALQSWKVILPSSFFFWPLYLLAGPLGATLGDVLTDGPEAGALAMNPLSASFAIGVLLFAGASLLARGQKLRPLA